jgi:hypothetical protein
VLHFRNEVIRPHERQNDERRNVLSRRDLLHAYAFWREEMAGLEHFTGCRLQLTHRQNLNWQVGFLFFGLNSWGNRNVGNC